MVPSQKASMSSSATPAEATASPAASTRRSSVERAQCSPKAVQPMPMTATRSRMPFEAIAVPLCAVLAVGGSNLRPLRPGLPEVVVDAAGGDHLAEGHLHPATDRHLVGGEVGELAAEAAATVEVDDRSDQRWAWGVGEPVHSEGGHGAGDVGERLGAHPVDGVAAHADPRRRKVAGAAGLAARGDESELPVVA